MQSTWLVAITLVAGCVPAANPGGYNALNSYGMPKDTKYTSYFDQATQGPTKDVLLGRLPAGLGGFDSADERYKSSARTAPNTADAGLSFVRADGDRICFSGDLDNADLNASQDALIDKFKRTEYVVHAIANRAAVEQAAIWPVQGARLDDFQIERDQTKDTTGGRYRNVSILACGARPANLESAEYLAVVVGGEVTGATDHGLLLWRLIK